MSLHVKGINPNGATATGRDFINNPMLQLYASDVCVGTSSLEWRKVITSDAYYLPCSQFDDYTTCNAFANCNYSYSSFIFINTSGCEGIVSSDKVGNEKYKVNLSIYDFPLTDDVIVSPDSFDFYTKYFGTGFCDSYNASGLNNRLTCEQFGCTWMNETQQNSQSYNAQSKFNRVSIWQVMKSLITFSFDFGFDPFLNLFVNFFLAIMLPLIIGALIYFMFVPF